ncbi:unnamed protein product [Schistosoma rodhaini]|uniref:Tetraspanin n=1 Tax=Schistosoma rodhaini TaxID=6188 RepID=A0AA85ET19_9TREM|nr:unnamed protein product [Schistosoma rodhaini]CAH8493693.1 unnamed protein product [Schistosoma rodhaini]
MALGCGYKCLQCLLIIFNCGAFICGLGLIVVGALGLHSVVNHWREIEPPLQSLIIFIIVLGCFLLVLGALGMFGACTKNVCLLTTYCILLSILIVAEIAAGIFAIVEKPKVKKHVTDALRKFVHEYYRDKYFKKVIDEIQQKVRCYSHHTCLFSCNAVALTLQQIMAFHHRNHVQKTANYLKR